MIFRIVLMLICSIMVMTPIVSSASEPAVCQDSDSLCKKLRKLTEAGKYDKVVAKAGQSGQYSDESRSYIGNAYLALAGREENTPEQEEQYCRKALEYGQIQAYMGLYFIYAQKDEETALGFLREYALTSPVDPVPFVLLGESEMQKKNYRAADIFLREAKRVARARSPRVDWMLFQTNYLIKNYGAAGEMLESALQNGRFDDELKALSTDGRFKGIGKRPEFKKHKGLFLTAKK